MLSKVKCSTRTRIHKFYQFTQSQLDHQRRIFSVITMATESVRTSTVVAAVVGTTITGLAAYAVYFDYKRRNDAEFRRNLKREAKKQAKVAREEAEGNEKKDKQELRQMVDEAVEEGWPTAAEEKETYFMEEVGMGEKLCQQCRLMLG